MTRSNLLALTFWLLAGVAVAGPARPCGAAFANDGAAVATRPVAPHAGETAEELAEKITIVPSERRRTELFDELLEQAKTSDSARAVIEQLLRDLWDKDHVALDKRSHTRGFEDLSEARAELDRFRDELIPLVRDTRRYPYPHVAPEASQADIKLHDAAQKKIDAGVRRMREIVRETKPARFSKAVRRHGSRLLWTRRAARRARNFARADVELLDREEPFLFYALPYEQDGKEISLMDLGLSSEEGERLAIDRGVRAQNRQTFEDSLEAVSEDDERKRLESEFDQVRLTNDYRQMFGLHALGWDKRLFEASRHHAEYLQRTGTIGHMQPDTKMGTYQQRARHFGYPNPLYENCTLKPTRAFDALRAWVRSSAHHRAVLHQGVSEMATARAGNSWVQNYGLDTSFRSGIQCPLWRD